MSFSSINTPVPGSRNPVSYINGLTASISSTTPTTGLVLAVGACSDSTNTIDMVVSSPINISATYEGVNGIDNAAALSASTIYYVYVIGSSEGWVLPQAILSTSATAPALPQGYDCWRMVDIKITGGASTFLLSYTNTGLLGREFVYDAPVIVLNGGAANSFTAVSLANVVAPLSMVEVNFIASITPVASTGAGDGIILRPTGSASAGYAELTSSVAAKAQVADLTCIAFLASGHAAVDYMLTASGDVGSLWVQGFQYIV